MLAAHADGPGLAEAWSRANREESIVTRAASRWLLAAALAVVGCDGTITSGVPGDGSGGGGGGSGEPAEAARFPGLTHAQWENTVARPVAARRSAGPGRQLPPDPPLGRFDNNVARLSVTSGTWQDYQARPRTMAERVTGDDPLRRIVPADLPRRRPGRARVHRASFGLRAFRRPLDRRGPDATPRLFATGATHYPGPRGLHRRRAHGGRVDAAVAVLPLPRRASDRVVNGACRCRATRSPAGCPTRSGTPCPTTSCWPRPPQASSTTRAGVHARAARTVLDDPRAREPAGALPLPGLSRCATTPTSTSTTDVSRSGAASSA